MTTRTFMDSQPKKSINTNSDPKAWCQTSGRYPNPPTNNNKKPRRKRLTNLLVDSRWDKDRKKTLCLLFRSNNQHPLRGIKAKRRIAYRHRKNRSMKRR